MSVFGAITGWFASFFDKRLWSKSGGERRTTSHEVVSEDSALNYSAVWCCTRLLCGTGASLPFPVYRGLGDETRKKERSHAVHRILNIQPNPEMTAFQFRSIMWQWQVNWGNAYAEIVREGNRPDGDLVALWPLHPDRVEACRDETGALYYKVRNDSGDSKVELEPWQMFHVPSIITYDGIVGHGVIAHAREAVGVGIASEKRMANGFGGGAMPQAVVEIPATWPDDLRKAFKEEWKELYSGADGDRIAVVQGGATVKPLSFSAQDSQYIEGRQFNIEEFARWYGIAPHLLHHLLRSTNNNIEHQGIDFVQYCLILWLRVWEQCVSQKLFRSDEQGDYFAEHNVDALLRGDHAARAQFYQTLASLAAITRNEIRKLENLPPVEGGDTFLVQGAMVPLDDDGRPVSKFVEGGAATVPPEPDETVAPEEDNKTVATAQAATWRGTMATVTTRLQRVIQHDLSRFLTKEGKAMANYARTPDKFMSRVEEFYADHAHIVRDEMTETLGALSVCGVDINVDSFVTSWVNDGKTLMLDASGTVGPSDLPMAIQGALESRTWTERPLRAVESVK